MFIFLNRHFDKIVHFSFNFFPGKHKDSGTAVKYKIKVDL